MPFGVFINYIENMREWTRQSMSKWIRRDSIYKCTGCDGKRIREPSTIHAMHKHKHLHIQMTTAAVCAMNDLLCVGREGASCVKIYFTRTLQMNIDGIFHIHIHRLHHTLTITYDFIYVFFFPLHKCVSCSNSGQVHGLKYWCEQE